MLSEYETNTGTKANDDGGRGGGLFGPWRKKDMGLLGGQLTPMGSLRDRFFPAGGHRESYSETIRPEVAGGVALEERRVHSAENCLWLGMQNWFNLLYPLTKREGGGDDQQY